MLPRVLRLLPILLALAATCGACSEPSSQGPRAEAAPGGVLPGSSAAADWVSVLLEPGDVSALPEQVATWSVVRKDPDRWGSLPRFPQFTSEAVLGLRPRLVFVSPWTDAAVVRRVREAGVGVVDVPEPSTWPDLVATGRRVAEAVDRTARFDAFLEELEARRSALAARAAARGLVRVLPYSNGGAGGWTMGADTTVDLALELAGCVNVAAERGVLGPAPFADEELLGSAFDWIVVGGEDGVSPSAEILRGKRHLRESVAALRADRIVVLSEAQYSSGSFTILDAAEAIADAIEARAEGTGGTAGR